MAGLFTTTLLSSFSLAMERSLLVARVVSNFLRKRSQDLCKLGINTFMVTGLLRIQLRFSSNAAPSTLVLDLNFGLQAPALPTSYSINESTSNQNPVTMVVEPCR